MNQNQLQLLNNHKNRIISLARMLSGVFNYTNDRLFLELECKIPINVVNNLYEIMGVLSDDDLLSIQKGLAGYISTKQKVLEQFGLLLYKSILVIDCDTFTLSVLGYIQKHKEVSFNDIMIHFDETASKIKMSLDILIINGYIDKIQDESLNERLYYVTHKGRTFIKRGV